MKLDVPDEYLPLVVTALEHYYGYTNRLGHRTKRKDRQNQMNVFAPLGSKLAHTQTDASR